MTFEERFRSCTKMVLAEHEAVFGVMDTAELFEFMQAIMEAERIFVVGAGREGIAARSFAMRIMHLGKETFWLWDDTTPGMRQGDLFLAVDQCH